MTTFFFTENEIEASGVEIYVRYTQDSRTKKMHTSSLPSPKNRNANHLSENFLTASKKTV